jgi:hypothetical protein
VVHGTCSHLVKIRWDWIRIITQVRIQIHGCQATPHPEVSQIIWCATFKTFLTSTPEMEAVYSSETLIPAYQTVQCQDREDHSIYVGESVLESTSILSEILVNCILSVGLGPKGSTYEVLSCQIVCKALHRRYPDIGDSTWFSHPLIAGKLLWKLLWKQQEALSGLKSLLIWVLKSVRKEVSSPDAYFIWTFSLCL